MKLKSNKKKTKALIIVGAILLAVLVLIGVLLIVNKVVDDKNGTIASRIVISLQPDKLTYYVGESLDPSGIEVQVIMANGSSRIIKNSAELNFSGFDSSEPCEALPITVSYMGVSAEFDISIIELPKPTPTLESIEVYDLQTEYDIEYWNAYGLNIVGSMIRLHYSDGSTVEDYLYPEYVSGVRMVDAPGTLEITVKYSDGVNMVETQVEITITE